MCSTCGCSQSNEGYTISLPGEKPENKHKNHEQEHHGTGHHQSHDHEHHHQGHTHTITLEQDILSKNNLLAERNRGYLEAKNIICFNLMSSPGAGKTTLLEKTIVKIITSGKKVYVIEGDQQTTNDADRIAITGATAIQINTGTGCHLDAEMVNKAIKKLNPENDSILFIENVGNLVCPALFDLGEQKRVVIVSTTEGEDKPIKYPTIFHASDICILNKTDLMPYLNFNAETFRDNVHKVNHHLITLELSAQTEEGIEQWLDLITNSEIVNEMDR